MADPIILTAKMGAADQRWANKLRQEYFPPERNFLDAHITLFHHLPASHLPEIKRRLSLLAAECGAPHAMLDKILQLSRGVAYRIYSSELLAMREELADAFHGLLIPQDQAKPQLHITIQNKVEQKEARELYAKILAGFEPQPLEIIGLSAYYYKGGPWEYIQSWKFRG